MTEPEACRDLAPGVEDGQFIPGVRPTKPEIEEARRVLDVGMTRAMERLVMTRVAVRNGKPTGGTQSLNEMELVPRKPVDAFDAPASDALLRLVRFSSEQPNSLLTAEDAENRSGARRLVIPREVP